MGGTLISLLLLGLKSVVFPHIYNAMGELSLQPCRHVGFWNDWKDASCSGGDSK